MAPLPYGTTTSNTLIQCAAAALEIYERIEDPTAAEVRERPEIVLPKLSSRDCLILNRHSPKVVVFYSRGKSLFWEERPPRRLFYDGSIDATMDREDVLSSGSRGPHGQG